MAMSRFGGGLLAMKRLFLFFLVKSLRNELVSGQFFVGFYALTCPNAESIVTATMTKAVEADPTIAASILRLQFHDCFVQGCDASILLDATALGSGFTEKTAPPNQSLRGYEIIDAAKTALEVACPGVVSCADVIAFAARDAVVLSGGATWNVWGGRRDGTISINLDAAINIPAATLNSQQLTQFFLLKGLSQDEMITLSGAHTIGQAHCTAFSSRLYNFNLTHPTDPSLDAAYATRLKSLCPPNANPNIRVPLDLTTPLTFDNSYYTNLAVNKGLLNSDQTLYEDTGFSQLVSKDNSNNPILWNLKFQNAMIRLASLNVKLGIQGEIRKNCRQLGS